MKQFIASTELRSGKAVSRDINFTCMFCSAPVSSDADYRAHLDGAHAGWAALLVARMGLQVSRLNG